MGAQKDWQKRMGVAMRRVEVFLFLFAIILCLSFVVTAYYEEARYMMVHKETSELCLNPAARSRMYDECMNADTKVDIGIVIATVHNIKMKLSGAMNTLIWWLTVLIIFAWVVSNLYSRWTYGKTPYTDPISHTPYRQRMITPSDSVIMDVDGEYYLNKKNVTIGE